MGKLENEKDIEEVDVTEIIERIEKLEKENGDLWAYIKGFEKGYQVRISDIESSVETVIESLSDESAGS